MNAKLKKRLKAIKGELEQIRNEAEMALDELPLKSKHSGRGHIITNNISHIDSAISSLEGIE